jgi:hypothetical protein
MAPEGAYDGQDFDGASVRQALRVATIDNFQVLHD